MRRIAILALLIGVAVTAWASFGSAASKKTQKGSVTSVTISNEQGTTWTCGFNPFNADTQSLSFGPVYEELTFVDPLKSGQTTNWLSSSHAWSNNNKTLTFTIRSGVKWSDGKPFSAADVLYTFKLLNAHPGLYLNAVWSVLKSVSQKGTKVAF